MLIHISKYRLYSPETNKMCNEAEEEEKIFRTVLNVKWFSNMQIDITNAN